MILKTSECQFVIPLLHEIHRAEAYSLIMDVSHISTCIMPRLRNNSEMEKIIHYAILNCVIHCQREKKDIKDGTVKSQIM